MDRIEFKTGAINNEEDSAQFDLVDLDELLGSPLDEIYDVNIGKRLDPDLISLNSTIKTKSDNNEFTCVVPKEHLNNDENDDENDYENENTVGYSSKYVDPFVYLGDIDIEISSHCSYEGALVEVKGPTDRLSHRQQIWLQVFEESGVTAWVCRISENKKHTISHDDNDHTDTAIKSKLWQQKQSSEKNALKGRGKRKTEDVDEGTGTVSKKRVVVVKEHTRSLPERNAISSKNAKKVSSGVMASTAPLVTTLTQIFNSSSNRENDSNSSDSYSNGNSNSGVGDGNDDRNDTPVSIDGVATILDTF